MDENITKRRGAIWALFSEIQMNAIPARSAGLAFYALFAFAPLILIIIVVTDVVLEAPGVQAMVFNIITEQVGPQIAPLLQQIETRGTELSVNIISGTIGLFLALYGATNFVMYLRSSFMEIFKLTPTNELGKPDPLLKRYVRSFVYMLILLIPLSAAILMNSVILFFLPVFSAPFQALFSNAYASVLVGAVVSVPFALFFFTFLYRIVSGGTVSWRNAFVGACLSSGLLFILSVALQVYFVFSTTLSVYGAAGSLIAFLLWLYYAIQAMLIGAEIARISASQQFTDAR